MPAGMVTTSDLTVGVKINMDEMIYLISPLDAPLLTGVDADGLAVLGSDPVDEIEFEWMDEEILVPRSQLNGAITTGDTVITLDSDAERLRFSTGDIIRIQKATASERIRITGYGATTATLLVDRAFAGTTATNYADNAPVLGLGTALAEGSDPEAARSRDRVGNSNYCQIFGPTSVHMSGTEQVVSKYGVPNEWAHQVLNRTRENVIAREQAFLYGVKYHSTTTDIRTTGGIDQFVTTTEDSTSTQLTVATIETNMAAAFALGGVPDLGIANPASLSDLNDISDSDRVRTVVADGRRGRQRVMEVWTEYGVVTISRNRWAMPTWYAQVERSNIIRRQLRKFQLERLAKTGDSDKAQILCEEGLEVKGEEHMFKMTNLAY